MSTIRMCRIPYAKTCTTWRIGGALPYAFADLCTDICPDMHQSPDAGRHPRYAASSPGLRRPRHTERTECHDVMPVFGAFHRIVYATAYRTVRGVKRRLNPAQHRRTHGIQKPEPRIRQGYHSAVRDTGHRTRPAAGISYVQRLLQSPFISADGVEDEHIDDSADTENAEYPALAPPCRARGSARDLAEREPSLADAFTFSGGSNRRPYPLMMKTQTGMPKHLAMHWMKAARFRHAYCPWSCPKHSRRCPSQCRLLVVTIRLQNQRHHSLRARSV